MWSILGINNLIVDEEKIIMKSIVSKGKHNKLIYFLLAIVPYTGKLGLHDLYIGKNKACFAHFLLFLTANSFTFNIFWGHSRKGIYLYSIIYMINWVWAIGESFKVSNLDYIENKEGINLFDKFIGLFSTKKGKTEDVIKKNELNGTTIRKLKNDYLEARAKLIVRSKYNDAAEIDIRKGTFEDVYISQGQICFSGILNNGEKMRGTELIDINIYDDVAIELKDQIKENSPFFKPTEYKYSNDELMAIIENERKDFYEKRDRFFASCIDYYLIKKEVQYDRYNYMTGKYCSVKNKGEIQIELFKGNDSMLYAISLSDLEPIIQTMPRKYCESDLIQFMEAYCSEFIIIQESDIQREIVESIEPKNNETTREDIHPLIDKVNKLYKEEYYDEAANNVRKLMEMVLDYLVKKYAPEYFADDNLGKIKGLSEKNVLNSHYTNIFHHLRKIGNKGSHYGGDAVTKDELKNVLPLLDEIGKIYDNV